ncbi:hypothetical protein O6H91_11G109400 [Diphasiastrum complanatum]|uniref:Uncharacterized protein n=1 Tax=Diphasiastrum complanatum TaxID=34168 RepID=A0ACC2CCT1_DIPCM|nr:hypothetical protein O6H91_11G109400 [Diphasiastrum complanatum]
MMQIGDILSVPVIAAFVVLCSLLWLLLRGSKAPKGVPPGSFGWPLIGESIEFLEWRRKLGTFALFKEKRKKYGDVFKTHLFFSPTVVITGADAHKLLQNDGYRTLTSCNTLSMRDLFGESLMLADGDQHKQMRKVIMAALQSKVLKNHIRRLEELSIEMMRSWDGNVISASEEFEKFTFYSVLGLLLSMKPSQQTEKMRHYFGVYAKDGISLPLNIPGTAYHRALQARKKLAEEIRKIIEHRRKDSLLYDDVLAHFMNAQDLHLSDQEIIDNLLFFIFAGYETTSTTLSRIVQLLADNPHELKLVQDEQKRIKEEVGDEASLTWEKTKSMSYTSMVINETLRLSHLGTEISIRTTKKDIIYEGYTIPKGWNIIVDKASIDINSEIFKEPLKFNPSRFKENIPPYVFMPFGGGVRSCPGMEFANLEILIFMHHFVNNYSWGLTNSLDGLEYAGLVAKTKFGVPIYVERLQQKQ